MTRSTTRSPSTWSASTTARSAPARACRTPSGSAATTCAWPSRCDRRLVIFLPCGSPVESETRHAVPGGAGRRPARSGRLAHRPARPTAGMTVDAGLPGIHGTFGHAWGRTDLERGNPRTAHVERHTAGQLESRIQPYIAVTPAAPPMPRPRPSR
ncbi:exported hypothetical protein [Frankia sp. AiPs1]